MLSGRLATALCVLTATLSIVACTGSDPSYVARDPCVPLEIAASPANPVERDGIDGAIALWRGRGVMAFESGTGVPSSAPAIEVRFATAGAVFHGVYEPESNSVVINRGLTDPAMVAIVIAHELGHVFGLAHVAATQRPSLMNPGNLVTPPTDDDQRALEALWGACN
jgi:hypothetical protein